MMNEYHVTPKLSVILPLSDSRDLGTEAFRRWAQHQSREPRSYEIIVTVGDDPTFPPPILDQILRPWDQRVRVHTRNIIGLIHEGVQLARAPLIFLTEAHCSPLDGTVDATLDWFAKRDGPGFYVNGRSSFHTELGEFEARMVREDVASWEASGHWMRLYGRGSAMRRSVYEQAGGLQPQHLTFAEQLFAARLWELGYRFESHPWLDAQHDSNDSVRANRHLIGMFVKGEARLRRECSDRRFVHKYFPPSREWENQLFAWHAPVADMVRALRQLSRDQAPRSLRARRALEYAAASALTLKAHYRWVYPRAVRLGTALHTGGMLWHPSKRRRYEHFVQFYRLTADSLRVPHARNTEPDQSRKTPFPFAIPLADQTAPDIFGFHQPERHNGRAFRWSKAVAAIRLTPPWADLTCRVVLANVRAPKRGEVAVFLGRHRLENVQCKSENPSISFEIPARCLSAEGCSWLIIATVPWASTGIQIEDRRELGLPIESIEILRATT